MPATATVSTPAEEEDEEIRYSSYGPELKL